MSHIFHWRNMTTPKSCLQTYSPNLVIKCLCCMKRRRRGRYSNSKQEIWFTKKQIWDKENLQVPIFIKKDVFHLALHRTEHGPGQTTHVHLPDDQGNRHGRGNAIGSDGDLRQRLRETRHQQRERRQDDQGADGQEIWAFVACGGRGRVRVWGVLWVEEYYVFVLCWKFGCLCLEVFIIFKDKAYKIRHSPKKVIEDLPKKFVIRPKIC